MRFSATLAFAILSLSFAAAMPLNINLGAYSPAIVVGDGALSFGGEAEQASPAAGEGAAAQPATGAGEGGASAAEGAAAEV
ncbi:hypothetical protein PVAG01_08346 [Phlyctema vagabunda]|uniref:Uncharacterized protein n=1 Tax=Phlyctema vagabunda TaxID=108571 RepID=A0ABR4P956_9HELO